MYKIGFVEDEKDLQNLVVKYLKNEGYEVDAFISGEEAMENINKGYHLWILDIMLPGNINGYDLIKEIKKNNPKTLVIFTSARDQDIDKIMGLELGSDDYVPKPYSIRELMLRIRNIFNRSFGQKEDNNVIEYNKYIIDLSKRIVLLDNCSLGLTSKEFDLLIYFIDHKNQAFSREQILNAVWGNDYFGSDRVVDDLLRRLRQKMPNLRIETIYGYGYRLV